MSAAVTPPGRLRLTAYAALQVAWLVPLVVLFVLQLVGGVLVVVWLGIPVLMLTVPALRAIATVQRRIAAEVLGVPVPVPYMPMPEGQPLGRLRVVAADPMSWRDLTWALWAMTVGAAVSLIVVLLLLGVVTSFLWWYGVWPLMTLRSTVDRALLTYGRTETLERRVQVLTRTRADAVDTSATELRRIERDLHDGAQARLVSLAMTLGEAETLVQSDPATARRLVAEARATSGAALNDIRAVVRGILPPVLADRGLGGAVEALALDLAVAVRVDSQLGGRPAPPIESAVYFAVAEALANVAKHARATSAAVELTHRDRVLRTVVRDDGRGGADPARGSGMRGVMRRLAALDGTMSVSSPVGGPTRIVVEVPCDLSSPRTRPSSAPGSSNS